MALDFLCPPFSPSKLPNKLSQMARSSADPLALKWPRSARPLSPDLSQLASGLPKTSDLLDDADDAPVIRLINGILQEAIRSRASDIHVEPYEERLSVRFRIDGTLTEKLSLPARLAPVLVSRVKVMARLDIANKRIPQDGRFSLNLGERQIDVRVSTLPARHGERLVMRILEKDCLLYTSPSPRDLSTSRMPSSA